MSTVNKPSLGSAVKQASAQIPKDRNPTDEFYKISGETCRTVIAIIDALTVRGAFKGEELSSLGKTRDNCVALVQMAETYENSKTQ